MWLNLNVHINVWIFLILISTLVCQTDFNNKTMKICAGKIVGRNIPALFCPIGHDFKLYLKYL